MLSYPQFAAALGGRKSFANGEPTAISLGYLL